MALFKKQDDHAGSGIDKPEKRGLVEKMLDSMKQAAADAPLADPPVAATAAPVPPKGPAAP
jgi:hypothetical protein